MRLLLAGLFVLIASVGFSLLAQRDTGYALLAYGEWTVETSLAVLLLATLMAFVVFHFLLRLVLSGLHLPGRVSRWQGERSRLQARRATQQGFIALAEGDWQRAERLLARHADGSDTPLLNYLGAARAAQKLGAEGRRDDYLARAHRSMPEARLAVGLTQAEVQLSHGQAERALATLVQLRALAPRNAHVLYLLKRLYERMRSWKELTELLPDLRRQKVLGAEALNALERRAHGELLRSAAGAGDMQRLDALWKQLPKPLRRDRELVEIYLGPLVAAGRGHQAEALLAEALRNHWEPSLVRRYGLVRGDAAAQLAAAETWLEDHGRDPDLLLTLGRLCLHNRLWGKARAYLEASLGAEPRPETYCELGSLLQEMGEGSEARTCFRRGLQLAVRSDCVAADVAVGPRQPPALAPVAERGSDEGGEVIAV